MDYLWTGSKSCLVTSYQQIVRPTFIEADISVVMGRTIDNWPHCGKVPGLENHFILAGFNGAGMPNIFLTARGIARMIRGNVSFEESGIPRIFKTTKERLKKDVT